MASLNTSIEWTDATWNVVRGCSLVSSGCSSCYAMKSAHRFSGKGKAYEGLTELGPQGPRWTGTIRLVPEALEEPLHWKTPRRIFVNSMSDLFHEDIPASYIVRVFEVMMACPQHEFQILTKRPERIEPVLYGPEGGFYLGGGDWLPNVLIGFSAEDQDTFNRRWQTFERRKGEQCSWAYAMRLWCSAEPLLGPINAMRALYNEYVRISWLVIGGESGPRARPCDLAWIRSIKAQCQAAGVPVFYKQGGYSNRCKHDQKGGHFECFPSDLKIREYPDAIQRS